MKEYSTSEVAKIIGIHPNTVRFYEDVSLLPPIPRKKNGYRVYNQIHIEQLILVRIALKSELLQNGLRKQVFKIIKLSAVGNYEQALQLSAKYFTNLTKEEENTENSIQIVEDILSKKLTNLDFSETYTRNQVAQILNLTIYTLRNWELNGLVTIKRNSNRYRVYDKPVMDRIRVIRTLRCANFSLSSILRLLQDLDHNANTNLRKVIDTPEDYEDIISVCDRLITSLNSAKKDAKKMIDQIVKMKEI